MSTPKLVNLRPEPGADNVVDLLEFLLAEAKAGNVAGVGVAVVYRSDETRTTWAFEEGVKLPLMVGSISILHHDFVKRVRESREE